MKHKELQDFKKKSVPEIEKALREHRKRASDLGFDRATGKLKNASEIKHIKKSIAQLLTIKQEQERVEMASKIE